MDKPSPFFSNLKCRECGRLYPKKAIHVCDYDFGPLEAAYDYDAIRAALTRQVIESRPQTMWRYRELLPIDGEPTVGTQVGFTPLVKAPRLAKALGIRELWVKNDTVNYPTLSFKDRVVSVALSRARELGFEICEQLGWRIPRHTVVPMASGSLLTKIHKAYCEFTKLGLVEETAFSVHGAQATGCAPIAHAMKKGTDIVKPVPKPDTIVKSL